MATAARRRADGRYEIDSFSEDKSYVVDLTKGICSCPHNQYRNARCKHLVAVEAQAPRIELLEKAARCTDEQLAGLLEKYGPVSPEIGGALRIERRRRQDAIERDAELRNVFA
jgi:SWIM zinc finger.